MKASYPIIVAGENFGCGSSREHAPIALGNCAATGELYPWESVERLCDQFETGQEVTIDFESVHRKSALPEFEPLPARK